MARAKAARHRVATRRQNIDGGDIPNLNPAGSLGGHCENTHDQIRIGVGIGQPHVMGSCNSGP